MMTSTNGKSPASAETVPKARRRQISVAEKIRILNAVDAAAHGKQGAVLRREGVYSSQVSTWKRQLNRGELDTSTLQKRAKVKDESKAAERRIAELTIKTELIHRVKWETREQVRAAIYSYIEIWYNTQRLHSTLGYRTPCEFEELDLRKSA